MMLCKLLIVFTYFGGSFSNLFELTEDPHCHYVP